MPNGLEREVLEPGHAGAVVVRRYKVLGKRLCRHVRESSYEDYSVRLSLLGDQQMLMITGP
jgi:hypothetical protein